MAPVSTPCIRVCCLDREGGLCEGCGRTAREIGLWGSMSEADRRAVMAQLADRLRRLPPPAGTRTGRKDRR